MCLMCEEEDLYFLYLEQRERAEKLARGETSSPDPGWLWPAFVAAGAPLAAPARLAAPAPPAESSEAAKPRAPSAFVCDTPE
jgi:hypothetical protein